MIAGAGVFSFTVGNLSTVFANFDTQASGLEMKLEKLSNFCQGARLSPELREELKKHIQYTSRKSLFTGAQRQTILSEFSPQLKSQVGPQTPFHRWRSRCMAA